MKTQSLPIELPRIDADTQSRIKINDDTVVDYAALIVASDGEWPFPPIDVFHDGTDYYVADGFHRLLGAMRTKRGSIPCRIHTGTAMDARIFGMTANDTHGMRMTRADKRACIEWLLDNGGKMTQKAIAEAVGVVARTVSTVVADRKYESTPPKPLPDSRGADTQVASPPEGGDGQPTDEPIEADSEPVDEPETPDEPPKRNGTPPKQYPGSHWFKQYQQAIGPLCRIVDKIAEGFGDSPTGSQKVVQDHLQDATEEMQEWLGVVEK